MEATAVIVSVEPTVEYPCDNEDPMCETREQYDALTYAVSAIRKHLKRHWQAAEEAHLITGDFLLYYEEGNPKKWVAPDVILAYDVQLPPRTPYLLWEVGKPPDLVMEVASPSTVKPVDQGIKHRLYQRLGIDEYWQYDPHGDLLAPRLQGWALQQGRYVPIPSRYDQEQEATMLYSTVLDTYWGSIGAREELRLWNPKEDAWILPDLQEAERADREAARAAQAAERADREIARAAQAAERVEQEAERADREAARAAQAAERVDREAERADREAARAAQAAERAEQAEARAAQAEAKLKRLGLA